MFNVNPMQLIQMIRNGQNPQQLMMSILQQNLSSTPLGQNIMTLANNGDTAGIEKIARNLCEQRGVDFDKEFSAFKTQIGIK